MMGVRVFVAHGERSESEEAPIGKADRRSAAGQLRGPQEGGTTRAPGAANYNAIGARACGMLPREAGKHVLTRVHMAALLRGAAMPPISWEIATHACSAPGPPPVAQGVSRRAPNNRWLSPEPGLELWSC